MRAHGGPSGIMRRRRGRFAWAGLASWAGILAASCCVAGEVYSNGYGGGLWSDPATWRGGTVPNHDDSVVVAARDKVVFDQNHEETASCADLAIDPRGVFEFKADGDRHVLAVDGAVTSYGIIRMNGRETPTGYCELRIRCRKKEDRVCHIREGGALLVYGHQGGAEAKRNVVLRAWVPDGESRPPDGIVAAEDGAMLDVQSAHVKGFRLQANGLDNTGYTAGERINIVDNRFTGLGSVLISQCDTPTIHGNLFDNRDAPQGREHAVRVSRCNLPQVRRNDAYNYYYGFSSYHCSDARFADNRVVDCRVGIHAHGGQVMFSNMAAENCLTGVAIRANGVVEDVDVRQATGTAWQITRTATLQLTDCSTADLPDKADPLALDLASIAMLNCRIPLDSVAGQNRAREGRPRVVAHYYLTVRVEGDVPADAVVTVRPVEEPHGAPGDAPAVRNSPAPLDEAGWTPRAPRMKRLIVRGETLAESERIPAPKYVVAVETAVAANGSGRNVRVKKVVQPDPSWFRANPSEGEPTVTLQIPQ